MPTPNETPPRAVFRVDIRTRVRVWKTLGFPPDFESSAQARSTFQQRWGVRLHREGTNLETFQMGPRGIGIETALPLAVGDDLLIGFDVSDAAWVVGGRVVWCDTASQRVGVQFIGISARQEDELVAHLFVQQHTKR